MIWSEDLQKRRHGCDVKSNSWIRKRSGTILSYRWIVIDGTVFEHVKEFVRLVINPMKRNKMIQKVVVCVNKWNRSEVALNKLLRNETLWRWWMEMDDVTEKIYIRSYEESRKLSWVEHVARVVTWVTCAGNENLRSSSNREKTTTTAKRDFSELTICWTRTGHDEIKSQHKLKNYKIVRL